MGGRGGGSLFVVVVGFESRCSIVKGEKIIIIMQILKQYRKNKKYLFSCQIKETSR